MRPTILQRLAAAALTLNTLLMLAGAGVVWYDRTRISSAEWAPEAPPLDLTPFRHLIEKRRPHA